MAVLSVCVGLRATMHSRAILDDIDGVAEPITEFGKKHHAWVRERGTPLNDGPPRPPLTSPPHGRSVDAGGPILTGPQSGPRQQTKGSMASASPAGINPPCARSQPWPHPGWDMKRPGSGIGRNMAGYQ